jgi:TusA-related sulfurtransferase
MQATLPDMLDITAEVCPMTFVRVKLKLAQMPPAAALVVRLRQGEALTNVPRSLRQEGHEIVSLQRETGDIHRLVVRKKAG